MASFVYAVWSITNVASMHCAVRPEISPCTCEPIYMSNTVDLFCERVDSFHKIVDVLSNKFTSNISISLKISHSQLEDLEMRSFSEMNLNVKKLKLISNNLRSVPELPFRGLSNVVYLSLAENDLEEIPKHVLGHLPKISTLDLGKGRIKAVHTDDFKGVPDMQFLFLVSNQITKLEKDVFPKSLSTLHLGRNQIKDLNGTLKDLSELKLLFINMNNLTTLDGELPPDSENLRLILAQNNSLVRLPQSMKNLPNLESLYFENNKLKSLDGIFMHGRHILRLYAFNNEIEYLSEDEFKEAELIEELNLAQNNIKSLNRSLLPIRKLQLANFSFNQIEEFSMNEIRGLEYLKSFDLSYNKIERLTGRKENIIEPTSFLKELWLQHNKLKSLDGALMGLNKLRILTLSNNQITRILPDDFIGLESLEILDLSFNQLLTLEETSTTFLPSLKILKAAYNNLTKLERDFHGLPVLCQANLTHNQIRSVSSELVSKTRCSNHGVFGKLEIWLDYNPIMCEERVADLCPVMENQQARIRGKSQCNLHNTNEEICTDPPIILKAPLPLIPQIIQSQLHQVAANPAIVAHPSLVQVIVPSPLIIPNSIIKAEIPIVSQTTTSQPAVSSTPIIISATMPQVISPQTEYTSIEYVPLLLEPEISSNIPENEENSINQEFSPVVLPVSENEPFPLVPVNSSQIP